MKNIGWIEIHLKKYGAIIYNDEARRALTESGEFHVDLVDASAKWFVRFRYLKIPEAVMRVVFLRGERDVWIRDFYSTLPMVWNRTKGKQVAIMHHLDFSGFPLIARVPLNILKVLFYGNLKKIDAIVVVSEYWKKHFEKRGYTNIHVIYNGFDLRKFDISSGETESFKKKYGLGGKPIVYIGNCQKPKGVVEAYNALKNLDVYLVTSGRREVDIPAKNFELEYREYLVLLKACSVVLTMSKFKEGWCRTAHEAMLVSTPVVGSGIAGMRELLEGGEQIVCEQFEDVEKNVTALLQDEELRIQIGRKGRSFAERFTSERFGGQWVAFLKQL